MNLKEAFRYQNFLDRMMQEAAYFITQRGNCLHTIKFHNRTKVNPDAENSTEFEESEIKYTCDDVISFMESLIQHRTELSVAIDEAKAALAEEQFDIDAAVAANKFRQILHRSIKTMLGFTPTKKTERGTDYKFNTEGNQMPYYYDLEVETSEAYDKENARSIMRSVILEADLVSSEVDSAMVNTKVLFKPQFDVNDTFDDAMTEFLAS